MKVKHTVFHRTYKLKFQLVFIFLLKNRAVDPDPHGFRRGKFEGKRKNARKFVEIVILL